MDALELLHGRHSTPAGALAEPGPAGADLDAILRAGVAAPDHDALRPWRFILIRGAARQRLGEVFAEATRQRAPAVDEATLDTQRSKPLRAPLVVAVAACVDPDNARVPPIEQVLSAGAALHQMQLAANALGYGSIWLTGPNAHDGVVAEALGLDFDDRLVGFLYLGTAHDRPGTPQRPDHRACVVEWDGPNAFETP